MASFAGFAQLSFHRLWNLIFQFHTILELAPLTPTGPQSFRSVIRGVDSCSRQISIHSLYALNPERSKRTDRCPSASGELSSTKVELRLDQNPVYPNQLRFGVYEEARSSHQPAV